MQAMPRAERNAPCHCGSGKKYKKCHLDADAATEEEQPAERPQPEPTGHEKRWNVLFEQLGTASPDEMLKLGRASVGAEPRAPQAVGRHGPPEQGDNPSGPG